MSSVCENGEHRVDGKPYEIPAGARAVTVAAVTVDWGDEDIRDTWAGSYTFCSFGCLAAKAAQWAADHDGRVVEHGATPEGDES